MESLACIVPLIVIGAIILYVGYLPGRIARRRNHPNADAICLCGRIGAIILPLWLVAIIWAHTNSVQPDRNPSASSSP